MPLNMITGIVFTLEILIRSQKSQHVEKVLIGVGILTIKKVLITINTDFFRLRPSNRIKKPKNMFHLEMSRY